MITNKLTKKIEEATNNEITLTMEEKDFAEKAREEALKIQKEMAEILN